MTGPRPGYRVLVAHPGAERYGSDRMLLESVRGMIGDGQSVLVALPGPGPLADDLRAAGAAVTVVPTPILRKSALSAAGLLQLAREAAAALAPTLALLRHRPDAVYVSTLTIPLWNVAARLTGAFTVVHVHEAEQRPQRLLNTALALPLLAAHRLIVNSEFSTSVLADALPALRRRADVVPNGVLGPARVPAPRTELDGPLRVLYVGRLSPRKGPQVLLAAARRLRADGRQIDVRLVGDVFAGYEWFADRLRGDNAAELANGSVELAGFVDDVWPQLAWADVAVVPSVLPEPFGNTAVEAALAGRPVIVSRCGGLPEAVSALTEPRTVTPGAADELAAALSALLAAWPQPAQAALRDVAATRERFSPADYRRRIAAAVRRPATRRRRHR